MKKEIRICGFGGQGVILSGFIIGKAAAVFMDYHAVQSQSYGPEARGGAARSEIVISDKKIGYPRPTSVDLLVSMSQEAFDSYRDDIRDDTWHFAAIIPDEAIWRDDVPWILDANPEIEDVGELETIVVRNGTEIEVKRVDPTLMQNDIINTMPLVKDLGITPNTPRY